MSETAWELRRRKPGRAKAGSAEYSLCSVSYFTVSPRRPSSCSTSPQAQGAAWTLKHAGQDDDGSDAICRAGRFARPDGRDPLVRPNPDGDARRPSLSLLPPDDDGQCGGAQGLLRRLASFPQGLVTAGPIRVRARLCCSSWCGRTGPLTDCRKGIGQGRARPAPRQARLRRYDGLRSLGGSAVRWFTSCLIS